MDKLEDIKRHAFSEKKRVSELSQIREIIFGAQDGLLVPLGVVSSVAGAFLNNHIVLIVGVSEGLAGAFSMATGAYLASRAEKEVFQNEIKKEAEAIKIFPDYEKQEMRLFFEQEGVSPKDAEVIVDHLLTSKTSFLNTMVQKEFGLDPNPSDSAMRDGIFIGFSYIISSIIPLLPYFFLTASRAIYISILLTLTALFGIGLLKAKYAHLRYLKSGLQVLFVGTCSGIGGYILGTMLPKIFRVY